MSASRARGGRSDGRKSPAYLAARSTRPSVKGARFVRFCTLQHPARYLRGRPGSCRGPQEYAASSRHGAKLLFAFAEHGAKLTSSPNVRRAYCVMSTSTFAPT